MKKNIYFFRHGQTVYNLECRWQGCGLDAQLNEIGLEQAQELAGKVCKLGLTILYSSPLIRAVQTANAIAQKYEKSLPIVILQDLREGNFGIVEGWKSDKVCETFGTDFVEDICYPTLQNWDLRFPKGESKHEMFNRLLGCLNYILSYNDDENIGIVCHAGLLSVLKCGLGLEKKPADKNILHRQFANCCVLHLQYDTDTKQFSLTVN